MWNKDKYSFNEILFRANNRMVIKQEFQGAITIEGYTDSGFYKFEYKEYAREDLNNVE